MSYCHLNATIALLFVRFPSQLIRSRSESAACLNTVSGYYMAYPNGGGFYRSGAVIPDVTFNLGNVDIAYTSNNGTTWNTIATNLDAILDK